MLHYASNIENYNLQATDGELGKVKNWYLDDLNWIIRYAAVDTRKWLPGRKVLISPSAIQTIDADNEEVRVRHDKDTVRDSPPLDETESINNDHEISLNEYYGWAPYWHGTDLWGQTSQPMLEEFRGGQTELTTDKIEEISREREYTLRETDDIKNNFTVFARKEQLGVVDDLLIDEENWKVRYLVIRVENEGEETHHLLSPDWISAADWQNSTLTFDISAEDIRKGPDYRNKPEISRQEEKEMYEHYYRAPYWE